MQSKKITKCEKGDNSPHLEITKAILVNCNIFNNDYQQNLRALFVHICSK